MRWLTLGVSSGSRIGTALALAGLVVALASAGTPAPASAAHRTAASGPSVGLSPCLLWGDALPVELSRGTAREAILCLVNEERAAAGLPMLSQDRRLQRASQRHTAAMDGTGCFGHRCSGESRLKRRLRRYLKGHPRRYKYGEVIAWAPAPLASPTQIVDALMSSSLHRAHILKPKYEHAGVGFTLGTPQAGLALGGIYTIDFGMRIG